MLVAWALVAMLVTVTVLIHYEALRFVAGFAAKATERPRRTVFAAMVGLMLAHLVEIAVYALGYWIAADVAGLGGLEGAHEAGPLDHFYFSAETFTTLGFGDIYPTGALRILAGVEPLNGLVLIAWSGSFTFLMAQRVWLPDVRGQQRPS